MLTDCLNKCYLSFQEIHQPFAWPQRPLLCLELCWGVWARGLGELYPSSQGACCPCLQDRTCTQRNQRQTFFGAIRTHLQWTCLCRTLNHCWNPVCYRALLWPHCGGAQGFRSLCGCREVSGLIFPHLPKRSKPAPSFGPSGHCPSAYSRGIGQTGLHSGGRKGEIQAGKGEREPSGSSDHTL